MSRYNYRQISCFGSNNSSVNDPLTYCMTDTMDKDFIHSPVGNLYGPSSKNCQLYMAQRCAQKWDGFCENYYQNQKSKQYPNTVQNCNAFNQVECGNVNLGETLLLNTAVNKYCRFPGAKVQEFPFDPTVANSPMIKQVDNTNVVPVCDNIDPNKINNDPVMHRLLANQHYHQGLLKNIYNNSQRAGINLQGTILEQPQQNYLRNKQPTQRKVGVTYGWGY